MEKREGIVAAGNWIVDRVKKIDVWPERGMLANILEESVGTGGAPYNVLIDLAKLKAGIPLYAAGIVGNDASGKFILKDLKANCIDITAMRSERCRICKNQNPQRVGRWGCRLAPFLPSFDDCRYDIVTRDKNQPAFIARVWGHGSGSPSSAL